MNVPVTIRYAAAAVLGVAAGAAAWTRVGEIKPYLDIVARRSVRTENYDLWDLLVTARGGETIGEVRVEPQSPRLRLVGPGSYRGLRSGWTKTFRLEFEDARDGSTARVYVWQEGPVSNTYDVSIGGER
jgi:hypothetical protein